MYDFGNSVNAGHRISWKLFPPFNLLEKSGRVFVKPPGPVVFFVEKICNCKFSFFIRCSAIQVIGFFFSELWLVVSFKECFCFIYVLILLT